MTDVSFGGAVATKNLSANHLNQLTPSLVYYSAKAIDPLDFAQNFFIEFAVSFGYPVVIIRVHQSMIFTIRAVLGDERKNKVSFLRNLVNRWNRIGCAGHFGAHHKWWQVLLFWAIVALAALAFLALRD